MTQERHRSKRAVSLLAFTLVLLLPLATACASPDGPPVAASRSPVPKPLSNEEQIRNADLLDQARAPLEAYLEGKGDGAQDPAYARATVDLERLTLQVLWKGVPPPEIRAMEGTTASGVHVVIENVPYSQGDMTQAATKVFDSARQADIPQPLGGVGASESFDALDVAFTAEQLNVIDRADLSSRIEALTGIPTNIVLGEEGHEQGYP